MSPACRKSRRPIGIIFKGAAATNITDIVAEAADEVGESTEVSVTYFSNGLWSSTGQGEENNVLPGADFNLMAGYWT